MSAAVGITSAVSIPFMPGAGRGSESFSLRYVDELAKKEILVEGDESAKRETLGVPPWQARGDQRVEKAVERGKPVLRSTTRRARRGISVTPFSINHVIKFRFIGSSKNLIYLSG